MPMGSLEFGLLLMDAEWRKDARTEARLYQMMKTSAGHDDLHPGSRRNEIAKAAERERGPLRQNEIVKKDCFARGCGLGPFAVAQQCASWLCRKLSWELQPKVGGEEVSALLQVKSTVRATEACGLRSLPEGASGPIFP
ncbi:unnamed protein product [Symbiodinium sp. CCMP2592]|nr:unnamed protein product [Symbiodinium sp. CCMP2592]